MFSRENPDLKPIHLCYKLPDAVKRAISPYGKTTGQKRGQRQRSFIERARVDDISFNLCVWIHVAECDRTRPALINLVQG